MPLENRTRFNKKDLDLIKQGESRVIGQFDSYNKPSTKGSKNINYRHATFTGLVSTGTD